MRNVPDVALNASDYTPVPVVSQGQTGYYYGTSLASPTFAGILVLLNQYLVKSGTLMQPGLGNVNTSLYRLAQTNPEVFHDITTGNNIVPCAAESPNCVNGQMGFSAGPGYDEATGLGSVDANVFVHTWSSSTPKGSAVVPSIDQIPVFQQPPDASGNQWTFTLTLDEEAGVATTLTGMTIDGHSFDPQASFGNDLDSGRRGNCFECPRFGAGRGAEVGLVHFHGHRCGWRNLVTGFFDSLPGAYGETDCGGRE